MMFFKRKKVKLSIIDDYIKILLIKNFYNNSFDCSTLDCNLLANIENTKELNRQLELTYNHLLKKLKLNDLSLSILKKELKSNNSLFLKEERNNFLTLNSTVEKTFFTLKQISTNLELKLKVLKLIH